MSMHAAANAWKRPVRLGVALGLVMGAVVLATARSTAQRRPGPLLSDCDGALEAIVIQYVTDSAGVVATAYREFLRQLPGEVTTYVVCPDEATFADFRRRMGPVPCRPVSVCTGHAMTAWARDRWLATAPGRRGGPTHLILPAEESGAAAWPARDGDACIGQDLARSLSDSVVAQRGELGFDGGDFVADAETVFVSPRAVRRNVARWPTEELRAKLAALLGRRIVLLTDGPDHHAGMFMMPAGGRTMIVGDPSLAGPLLAGPSDGSPALEADFSPETKRLFDAVAGACRSAGYRVVRIPVVPGTDGRTYLTYLNVIIDERGGTRTVYMPVYRGTDALNAAGTAVWRSLGYRVCPVDCTETCVHFGSLRCLVNVLRRSPATGGAEQASGRTKEQ